MHSDLDVEKYKACWEYIKQVEEGRLKQMQIYLIIVSTAMGIMSYLGSSTDHILILNGINKTLAVFCLGLAVYGVILCLLFNEQKRYHDDYRRQIIKLEKKYAVDYETLLGHVDDKYAKKTKARTLRSPSFLWYLLTVTVTVMPFAVAVHLTITYVDIGSHMTSTVKLGLVVCLSALLYIVLAFVFILSRWHEYKMYNELHEKQQN